MESETDELRGARKRRQPPPSRVGPSCTESPDARGRVLYNWLCEKHPDLTEVLGFGTQSGILHMMTSTVAEGAAKLADITNTALT